MRRPGCSATSPTIRGRHVRCRVAAVQHRPQSRMGRYSRLSIIAMLLQGGPESRARRAAIAAQQHFLERIVKLVKGVARESGNRKKKTEKLQALLSNPDQLKYNFMSFDAIPFPLDPDVHITGIIPMKATLFKVSLFVVCRNTVNLHNMHTRTIW